MAIALCYGTDIKVISRYINHLTKNLNVEFKGSTIGERVGFVAFQAKSWEQYEEAYKFCMNAVVNFAGGIAFLGINEQADDYNGPYSLGLLTNMPSDYKKREEWQKKAFRKLISDFCEVTQNYDFTWEEVMTVCQRCAIGESWQDSALNCARIIHRLFTSKMPVEETESYINSYGACVYSIDHKFNNIVLCMAHFCMLRLTRFKEG